MNQAKRKPSWTLCVNDARSGERPRWRNIGAAWETERGNLFVKIDDGERLDGTAMMFPYREKPAGARCAPRPARPYPPQHPPADDYMEKRAERRSAAPPSAPYAAPPTAADDDCPDPQAPDWL